MAFEELVAINMVEAISKEEVKAARQELGLTQLELAGHLGVNGNTLARWERGDIPIAQAKMLALAMFALRLLLARPAPVAPA